MSEVAVPRLRSARACRGAAADYTLDLIVGIKASSASRHCVQPRERRTRDDRRLRLHHGAGGGVERFVQCLVRRTDPVDVNNGWIRPRPHRAAVHFEIHLSDIAGVECTAQSPAKVDLNIRPAFGKFTEIDADPAALRQVGVTTEDAQEPRCSARGVCPHDEEAAQKVRRSRQYVGITLRLVRRGQRHTQLHYALRSATRAGVADLVRRARHRAATARGAAVELVEVDFTPVVRSDARICVAVRILRCASRRTRSGATARNARRARTRADMATTPAVRRACRCLTTVVRETRIAIEEPRNASW